MVLLTAVQIKGGCYRTSRFFLRSAARVSWAFAPAFCFLSTDSGTAMLFLVGTLHASVLCSRQLMFATYVEDGIVLVVSVAVGCRRVQAAGCLRFCRVENVSVGRTGRAKIWLHANYPLPRQSLRPRTSRATRLFWSSARLNETLQLTLKPPQYPQTWVEVAIA
jgi:hypothetical protein